MIFESLTAAITAITLYANGIPTTATGNVIFVLGQHQPIIVEFGLIDWMILFLLDFLSIFATWTFLTARGRELSTRVYLLLATIIFPIMFVGNGVRIAAQLSVYLGSSPGPSPVIDEVGLGVLFSFAALVVVGSCLLFSTLLKDHVRPFDPSGLGKNRF